MTVYRAETGYLRIGSDLAFARVVLSPHAEILVSILERDRRPYVRLRFFFQLHADAEWRCLHTILLGAAALGE